MARFFTEHPNPWGWSALQYCGLPSQFVYLPALHYGTAVISAISGIEPAYAYRLLTASLACLGPVTFFLFVLFFTRSRGWALAAALSYTFFSPLYGLIRQLDQDRGLAYLPWRLHVFAKYGEGPHNAGLTFIPLALIASYWTLTQPRRRLIAATALIMAAITLTNWVAALGLALCCVILMLAGIGQMQFSWTRLFAAGALAYGLACFWLTPTFISTIAFNWPADAFNYKLQMAQRWLLLFYMIGVLLLRAATYLLRWPLYETFVTLGIFAFGYPVLFFYSYGLDMIPESRRYALEFEFFLFAALFAFLRFGFTSPNRVRQVCALAVAAPLMLASLPQLTRYLTQGQEKWKPLTRDATSEYQVAKWLADRKPRGRVLASGGLRFRLNSWFDLEQVGGAFESGLRNRTPVHYAYQIRTGIGSDPAREAADAVDQLTALGVEYVVIHGPKSEEHYRDYRNPLKFEGVLERVYADADDYIYRVPFRSYAHLLHPDEQPKYSGWRFIGSYVRALQDESRAALQFRWTGPSAAEITGSFPDGYNVTLAISHDSGWTATQNGSPVPIGRNELGFLTLQPRTSSGSTIRLEYRGTREQKAMAAISAVVWIGAGIWLWPRKPKQYHRNGWQTPSASTASA